MLPRLLHTALRHSRTLLTRAPRVRPLRAASTARTHVTPRTPVLWPQCQQQRALHLIHAAAKSYAFSLPTHSCGSLSAQHSGQRVVLGGWIEAKRILTNVNKKQRDGDHTHVLVFIGTYDAHEVRGN